MFRQEVPQSDTFANRVTEETKWAYQHSLLAVLNPSTGSKVSGFSTVEAVVEASMITIWESDHKLSRFLGHLNKSGLKAAATHGRG